MSECLSFDKVNKTFGSKKVLDDISFKIETGKIIGLISPNGSGKTTIIKLICDLLTADSGEIKVDGRKIGPETKAIVSYLPDRLMFNRDAKISEAIKFYKRYYKDFDTSKFEKYLKIFKIDENGKVRDLSKGTVEIFQLLLTLCRPAKLYLLDEPLASVDPVNREAIIKTIIKEYSENSSVIISTHLLSDVESILDEVIMIKECKLFCHKSVEDIREETGKSLNEFFKDSFRVDWFGGEN